MASEQNWIVSGGMLATAINQRGQRPYFIVNTPIESLAEFAENALRQGYVIHSWHPSGLHDGKANVFLEAHHAE